jgi:hypothetical protein
VICVCVCVCVCVLSSVSLCDYWVGEPRCKWASVPILVKCITFKLLIYYIGVCRLTWTKEPGG